MSRRGKSVIWALSSFPVCWGKHLSRCWSKLGVLIEEVREKAPELG